jgi:hypothetical protein
MKKALVGIFALDLIIIGLARRQPRPPKIRPRSMLDLNTADRNDLLRLPGLSPFLADRIIENRPYRNKLDLLSRRVIPDAAYRRISHQVHTMVDGDQSVLAPIAI